MAKNNPKRNKEAGHAYERKHVRFFRELLGLKNVTTSREANLSRDKEGIDLTNFEESVYGRLFIDVQCKKTKSSEIQLPKVLENMVADPNRLRVVFWEQTHRCTDPGIHFDCMISIGEYAFCTVNDFYKLLAAYVELHGINRMYLPEKETQHEKCRRLLMELVQLKELKDTSGKTEDYLKRQPLAWEQAREFLNLPKIEHAKDKDEGSSPT